MRPGSAAISLGQVWHRRNEPAVHEFTYPVNHIWIDPDRPQDLFDHHPLWSHRRRSPIRFRRRDYFDGGNGPIGPSVLDLVGEAVGRRPAGPVRMLTQPRTWGWLFNPITVYLVWDGDDSAQPVGVVLEVTNTPWKERTTYPVALQPCGESLRARFDKSLHVSPFLDEDYRYHLAITPGTSTDQAGGRPTAEVTIDVVRPGDDRSDPVVQTALSIERRHPSRSALTAALTRNPLPTHRVSFGIHAQAARLLAKRVPFVSHPKRTT